MAQKYRRILWVWKPKEINHARQTKELFDLCKERSITHIYYQVMLKEEEFPEFSAVIEGQEFYRDFLREAHEAGLNVYALLSPSTIFGKKGRGTVKAQVQALQDFNSSSQKAEHFDGVHFSFDLHFAEGAHKKAMQTKVLEFLQLLRRVRIYTHFRRPHLTFGVDLPFWFLTANKGPLPRMIFSVKLKQAGEHLLDIVDEAVVFPYRTEVSGEQGILPRVMPAISYASRVNKKVFIGLETMALTVKGASFADIGFKGLQKTEQTLLDTLKGVEGFHGIGVHDYENYRKLK